MELGHWQCRLVEAYSVLLQQQALHQALHQLVEARFLAEHQARQQKLPLHLEPLHSEEEQALPQLQLEEQALHPLD